MSLIEAFCKIKYKGTENKLSCIFSDLLKEIIRLNPQLLSDLFDNIFPGYFGKDKTDFCIDIQKHCLFERIQFRNSTPDCGIEWIENNVMKAIIIEFKKGDDSFAAHINQFQNHLQAIAKHRNTLLLGVSDDSEKRLSKLQKDPSFADFNIEIGRKTLPIYKFITWDSIFEFFKARKSGNDIIPHYLMHQLFLYKEHLLGINMQLEFNPNFHELIIKAFEFKSNEIDNLRERGDSFKEFKKLIHPLFLAIKKNFDAKYPKINQSLNLSTEIGVGSTNRFPLRYYFLVWAKQGLFKNITLKAEFRKKNNGNEEFVILLDLLLRQNRRQGDRIPINQIIFSALYSEYKDNLGYYDGREQGQHLNFGLRGNRIEFKKRLASQDSLKWQDLKWLQELQNESGRILVEWISFLKTKYDYYHNLLLSGLDGIADIIGGDYQMFEKDGIYYNRRDRYGLFLTNQFNGISLFFGYKVNFIAPYVPFVYFFIEADPNLHLGEQIKASFNGLENPPNDNFEIDQNPGDWQIIERIRPLSEFDFTINNSELHSWFNECVELVRSMNLTRL